MANSIFFRKGTAAHWATSNPILRDGEPGYEKDTGKMKVGDGVTAWNDLENSKLFYENPIDKPPTVPNIMDDEFDGVSLDAKWSWLNQIGALLTFGDGKLRISSPTSNGSATLVQTAPTGNFTITTKLDIVSKYENYHGGGLYLYNQTLNRAVSFIKQHRSDSFGHYLSCYRWADKAAVGTYQTIGYHGYPNYKYIRIKSVGGSLYCETSLDGVTWIPVYTELLSTYLTAITHIGLGTYKIGTLNILSIFDWFRVTEP